MINAISGTQQQYYTKPTAKQSKEVLDKNNKQNMDTYVATKPNADSIETEMVKKTEDKALFYGLDDKEWQAFAKKYDVENLTREEKKQLLTELKDKGVLNEKEYQTTNLVFIPCDIEQGGKITIGEQKTFDLEDKNWLNKFDNIANYCDSLLDMIEDDSSKKQNIEEIRNIYLKIADIFDKIAEERKKV